ncbi:MAG: hypothetical protein ABIQ57_07130 [Candidatus Kapaibacterium sp.]
MKALISLIAFVVLTSCNKSEQDVVVVPKNFKGYVLVIFNQKNGAAPKYEDNKRVYEIPENGILKTQFESNYGVRILTEFYRGKISSENKLTSFASLKDVPDDLSVGLLGASGTVKKSAGSEERIEFAEFYIGTKMEIDQEIEQTERLDILKLAE